MRTTRMLCATPTLTSLLFASAVAFGQDGGSGTLDSVAPPQDASAQAAPAQAAQSQPAQAAPQPEPVVGDIGGASFGKAGQFAVSAERMFGVAWESFGTDVDGTKTTRSTTVISFVSNQYGALTGNYSIPRLGADYFVIDGLSIGASLGYVHMSGHRKSETNGVSTEADTGSASGFIIAPRVGYAAMFSPTVGIWPRAGVTHVSVSTSDADGNDAGGASRTALSLEAPLVISPVRHTGFSIGPSLDYGIAGSNEEITRAPGTGLTTTTSVDVSTLALGLHAGLFVYF